MSTTVPSQAAGRVSQEGLGSRFAATRWSVVLAAGGWRESRGARRAMGELARVYWFPLYAYARRRGADPARAQDLVQGFLLQLLEKDGLAGVGREKGKFRSFLMVALKNHMTNVWGRESAAKRGGGARTVSIDTLSAETRYASEPVDAMTPERLFERRWALAVLEEVVRRLAEEYAQRGQARVFGALEHVLIKGGETGYAQIALELGMSQGAVKTAAHRLRRRYRDLLRDEIAQTVSDPGQVDEEVRQLLESL